MANVYGQTVGGLLGQAARDAYDAVYGVGSYIADNPQTAGLLAGQLAPGAGTADALGQYPDPFNPTQNLPSLRQNIAQGQYLDAGFQGLGLLGDAAMAVPVVGPAAAGALKAPRVARIARAGDNNPPGAPLVNTGGDVGSVNEPAGSYAMYRGAAPDRSGGSFERYTPARGVPAGVARLVEKTADPDNPIVQQFDRFVEKGIELEGPDWYNTEELRDWFVSRLGEERGAAEYNDYINLIGATSTGARVPDNLRMASFYRALNPEQRVAVANLVKDKGMRPRDAAASLGIEIPNLPEGDFGYGHQKQRNMAGNILNQEQGNWAKNPPEDMTGAARTKYLQANPKVKGFANSLVGNVENIAADIHFMRMLAMSDGGADLLSDQFPVTKAGLEAVNDKFGKKLVEGYTNTRKVNGKDIKSVNLKKMAADGHITDADTSIFQEFPSAWKDTPSPTEYEALEQMAQNVAARYDMTPAQFQASLWMGAGEMTNLADESQGTAMELFRRALDNRADERGITREDMLKDFIDNKGLLAVPTTAAGGALTYGLLQDPQQEQQPGIF